MVTFAVTFNNIIDAIAEAEREQERIRKSKQICTQNFSSTWIDKLMGPNESGCSKEKFVLAVLIEMEILSMKEDVRPLLKVFCLHFRYLIPFQFCNIPAPTEIS